MSVFPEEWQQRILQESIFIVLSENRDPELAKLLMTEERCTQLEEIKTPESLRCLFAWNLRSEDRAQAAAVYETEAIKAAGKVAFRPASEAWRRMIIECRWIGDRYDEFDLMD